MNEKDRTPQNDRLREALRRGDPGDEAAGLSADLLPFKGYEQLDSGLLRTTSVVEGHLVGRDGRQYRVWLRFQAVGSTDNKELFVDQFQLRENASFPTAKSVEKGPPRSQRDLISTSFGLKQGETIVVGTSKSDEGDEALVLLLTAVP